MSLLFTDNFLSFFSFSKKHKRSGLFFILPLLSICIFIINPSFAAVNSANDPVVIIAAKNEPLKKVLDKISKSTGYKIEVTEGWGNRLVTTDFINASLDISLKKLLKALGGPSNSIITYENTKKIKINIFESSRRSSANITEVYPEEDDNKVMDLDLTFTELKELHIKQEQEYKKDNQNQDEIVVPAEGDQPAVTRSQLENLHKKQQQEFKKNNPDKGDIVIPAEGDQPAVTRSQLENLHKRQQQEFNKNNPVKDEVVIPAEGDRPAVTRKQLEELHAKQKRTFEMEKAKKQDIDNVIIPLK
jgi:hypothetical protein